MRTRPNIRGLPAWRWLDNTPPANFTFEQPLIDAILIPREHAVERALKRMKIEVQRGRDHPGDRRRRLRIFMAELNGTSA